MREINANVKMTQVTELADKHIKTVQCTVQGARGKLGSVKQRHGRKKKTHIKLLEMKNMYKMKKKSLESN